MNRNSKISKIPFKQIAGRIFKAAAIVAAILTFISAPGTLSHAYASSIAANKGIFASCLHAVGAVFGLAIILFVAMLPTVAIVTFLVPDYTEMYQDMKAFVLGIPAAMKALGAAIGAAWLWLGAALLRLRRAMKSAFQALCAVPRKLRSMTAKQWKVAGLTTVHLSVIAAAVYFTESWLLPHKPHFLDKMEFGTFIAMITIFVVSTVSMFLLSLVSVLFRRSKRK